VTDQVVAHHLRGQAPSGGAYVAGAYPILSDGTCWFLAADFDEAEWRRDVKAFAETCRAWDVPVAIERSRSGNGAHAWIFFSEPVSASLARRLGSASARLTAARAVFQLAPEADSGTAAETGPFGQAPDQATSTRSWAGIAPTS
jgi:hypothetical protein